MTTLNNTFAIELAQEDESYESGSESLNMFSPLRRAPWIYHISMSENLSFDPTRPLTTAEQHPVHSPWRLRYHSPVCCHLVFSSSNEESPIIPTDPHLQCSSTPDNSPIYRGAEPPSPVHHHVNHHHMSTPSTDEFFFQDATADENFPTAPLDDDILLEDQIPNRPLCNHEPSKPNYQCSYPCPYSLDLPQYSTWCNSTLLWSDGPQWHLHRHPRCNDHYEWWGHP